ncbi:MAG: GerMN domain-containing protein [Syntrophorhabdaceae bacterium]|nr:GerMN domain-containing protein [Syntrophorhabdaceae bacterium]
MRRKKQDIYIEGKPRGHARPVRTPYIIALAVIAVAAAGFFAFKYVKVPHPPKTVIVEETGKLKIYVPSLPGKLELKSLPIKTTLTDKETADEIILGLKNGKVLPDTLSLTEFASDTDGTLILNFTPDIALLKLDPLMEIQTVYAIVNSFLANFTKAKNVQLLAGGQALSTISGTVYTYKPMEFNSHILED